jgi:hypothetical protein
MADEPISTWARVALLPGKLRERGVGWLVKRVVSAVSRLPRRILGIVFLASARFLIRSISLVRLSGRETLAAYCDLEIYPISYDICWFLVWADLERERRGLKRLHVIFIPIDDHESRQYPPGYDAVVDLTSRNFRFQNICASMPQLDNPGSRNDGAGFAARSWHLRDLRARS